MKYDHPLTKNDFKNAFFMNDRRKHVVIDGIEMTAQNIWNCPDRNALLDRCVDYFYTSGFAKNEIDEKAIVKDIENIIAKDVSEAVDSNGQLKNTSTAGLEACRNFCYDSFYNTSANGTLSIKQMFSDRDAIRKILKNRMGWYTTTEPLEVDGKIEEGEHPYVFDLSYKMLVQGAHSAMICANISNFRPLVAKYLIDRYCDGVDVLDLSIGWGARYLAAMSLKKNYYGIDPMTAKNVEELHRFTMKNFKENSIDAKFIENGSEIESSYENFPSIDYAIACPPYFNLEEYKSTGNSTTIYPNYDDWLGKYWGKTVQIASTKLKKSGKFTLIIVDSWEKYNLAYDMCKAIEDQNFKLIETIPYKTTRSHLTNKRKTGIVSKNTEKAYTFEKL